MSGDAIVRCLVIGFMLVGGVLFAVVAWQKAQEDKERIRNYLLDKGCREIAVHYEWFDFDKSNSTYRVECRHPTKGRIRTICKIHRGFGWEEEMYWKDPL